MKLTNTAESYGLIHQSLHWATAILILILLPMGVYMHDLPIDNSEQIADKVWLYSLHKSIGMAALFVAIARIAWAVYQPHPRPLHGGMEGFAAKTGSLSVIRHHYCHASTRVGFITQQLKASRRSGGHFHKIYRSCQKMSCCLISLRLRILSVAYC